MENYKSENGKPNHCKNTASLRRDNKAITYQDTTTNICNSYFLSVAESLNSGNNKHTNIKEPNPISYLINSFHRPFPKMSWHYALTYEIEKIIKSLKSKNSGGCDEISTRIPKLSAPYIISPLTYICNAILNTSIFPDKLKYASIKPVFKKGDDQDITNYRPISLLTSFSKVIEKLIYARLLDHIITNSILVNEQYRFRIQYSTEQVSFSLINSTLTAMNNNLKTGGIFCNLQNVFECVNHKILLDKPEFYGTEGNFKTLIKFYLTCRY